jgi:hypothetical protein
MVVSFLEYLPRVSGIGRGRMSKMGWSDLILEKIEFVFARQEAKINEVFTPAQRTILDTSRKELQQRGRPGPRTKSGTELRINQRCFRL